MRCTFLTVRKLTACAALLAVAAFAGCSPAGTVDAGGTLGTGVTPSVSGVQEPAKVEIPAEIKGGVVSEDYGCEIILSDNGSSVNGNGVSVLGDIITIDAAGTYLVSGSLTDGQLIVDSDDEEKVKIIFNGVFINSSVSAAVYIKNVQDKVILQMAEDSVNILSDAEEYSFDEGTDEPSACIFSKDDLKIKGTGTLYVAGNYSKGIFSKDDFILEEASVYITAADDGIRGKDSVEILSGTVVINAGGDGIRTSNDAQEGKGSIAISGGNVQIISQLDAIQSAADLTITGGAISVKSGGGSENSSKNNSSWGDWGGDRPGSQSGRSSSAAEETETESAKGIKAQGTISINGGAFVFDTSDDSLHSNTAIKINGGEFSISSGDDGIHADDTATISGGHISIEKSYEGIEAQTIKLEGGDVSVTASDDGINAAGGSDSSGMNRPGQGGFMGGGAPGSGSISISGGNYIINAEGDGIDSNGSIAMTGGSFIVYGPVNNGNGALDYDGSFNISGGTMIALGSSGMAQGASGGSSQSGLFTNITGTAGKTITVTDAGGNVVAEFTSPKQFGNVFISNSALVRGQSYTFTSDGSKLKTVSAS